MTQELAYTIENPVQDNDSDEEPQTQNQSLSEMVTQMAKEDQAQKESERSEKSNKKTETPKKIELDEKAIADITASVKAIFHEKVEGGRLEIGEYLFINVFHGKMEQVISRSPQKNQSFEKISKKADIGMDATTLATWVKAAAVKSHIESYGAETESLTLSHLAPLARIKNSDHRLQLASKVVALSLSVRDTKELVECYISATRSYKSVELSGDNLTIKNVIKRMRKTNIVSEDVELFNYLSDEEFLMKSLNRTDRIILADEVDKNLEKTKSKMAAVEKQEQELADKKLPLEAHIEFMDDLYERIQNIAFNKN